MKKIMSSLLICSTLFSCFNPAGHCFAEPKPEKQKVIKISISPKDSFVGNLSDINDEALKDKLLELSKDKKFTDKLAESYKESHKDPLWLKVVKFPFKAIWYVVKTTLNYTIGKKVSDFIENTILPAAMAGVTGWTLYKNVDWVHDSVDKIIAIVKSLKNEKN